MTERTTATIEEWEEALGSVVAELGLELVEVRVSGGPRPTVCVVVDRVGGVDLEAIGHASEAVSRELDVRDPMRGPYTLEVSSPGIERPLRRPEHFARAVGARVSVVARSEGAAPARLRGTLTATDEHGITVDVDGTLRTFAFAEVDKARTVFEWGGEPKPGSGSRPGRVTQGRTRTRGGARAEAEHT